MNINIDGNDLVKHLTFWHNKTDDECIEMATGEFGVIMFLIFQLHYY